MVFCVLKIILFYFHWREREENADIYSFGGFGMLGEVHVVDSGNGGVLGSRAGALELMRRRISALAL